MAEAVIVTDASVDLPAGLARDLGIVVAPVGYELGGKRYLSGEQSPDELYAALQGGADATVEGVAADDFERAFEEASGTAPVIICACQSVGSSFTRVSAEVAARRVTGGASVRLISTGRSTAALAAICIAGAQAARDGRSADEVFALMEDASTAADTYLVARDLGQLERSGQLSAVASQSGVGRFEDGVPLFRLRGRLSAVSVCPDREAAEAAMVDAIAAKAGERPVILIASHAGAEADAARLLEAARPRLNVASEHTTVIGPVIATLLGAGTVGLGFCVTG